MLSSDLFSQDFAFHAQELKPFFDLLDFFFLGRFKGLGNLSNVSCLRNSQSVIRKQKYFIEIVSLVEFTRSLDDLVRIVHILDERHSHHNLRKDLRIRCQPLQILKDQLVGMTHVGLMDFIVDGLHVEKNVGHLRTFSHGIKPVAISVT